MSLSIVVIIVQLIFLEGILSIDNAAVLGAMVTTLPTDKPIPWPGSLRFLKPLLNPILGPQRFAALRVGLLGAYIGRGLMLLLASLVIQNPWIKILGAAYLIRLAFDNLGEKIEIEGQDQTTSRPPARQSFWWIVLTVEIMDLVFSIDNVVAAVSLSKILWVVMVGVAIGILTMRFAAGAFSYLVEHEPVLYKAAYVLIFNIGIELLVEELGKVEINDWLRFAISVLTILLAIAYGRLTLLQQILNPFFSWISHIFGLINGVIDWCLKPVSVLIQRIQKRAQKHLRHPSHRQ